MSLRSSIILLIITITLGTGLGSSFLMTHVMHEALEDELRGQAIVAVQSLGLHVTHNVINGEVIKAQESLNQIVEHSPSIEYAYIFDFEGKLFAHSFENGFPVALSEGLFEHHSVSAELPEIRRFKTTSNWILEIGYPLIDGMKGHVHVGLYETPMQTRLYSLRLRIIILTLLLTGLGIAMGIYVSRRLTTPLSELSEVMLNLEHWEDDVQVEFKNAGFEVANLSHSFNRMFADRRRDSKFLRESEERLQAVFSAADNVAFVTTDLGGIDTRILGFSPGAEKIFGYKSKEMIGQNVAMLHTQEMVEKFPEMQKAIKEGGKGHSGETILVRKSGEKFSAIFTIHPLLNGVGSLVGTLGVTIDITERKRAEQALKESEDRFWSLFENAPMGYQSLNAQGDFIDVNETWRQMFGYSKEEIFGKNFSEFLTNNSLKTFHSNFPVFKKRGYVLGAEFEIFKKDGTTIITTLDGKIEYQSDGLIKQTHCVLKDITERKKAEKELQREKDKAETYLRISAVIMVAINLDGVVTMINQKGCNILGYEESEILGKVWFDHFVPKRLTGKVKVISTNLLDGNIKNNEFYENHILTKSGEERLVAWHNSTIQDNEGAIIGHLSSGEDITEQKQLREELQQAQKMESVGRLAGGVAHDFNNMLGVILGYAEIASDLPDSSPSLQEALVGIKTAAERSADLTRQLLAFARKQPIAPQVLDLNEAVARTLTLLERLIGEDISLAWKPQVGIWFIKFDSSQIDQILINLCINAKDAIEGVGQISIESKNISIDQAELEYPAGITSGEYVLLSIHDTGIGMDHETLDNLFEPFFTTKEIGKGTGLGLAMIYGIVQQNSGHIQVGSQQGEGTTFYIYLPRHISELGSLPALKKAGPIVGGQETILLVEDEALVLELTTRILKDLGYDILGVSSPKEAIKLVKTYSGEISLVCTDVVMPEMSGLELIEILNCLMPDFKSLFMSGYTADVIAHHGVLDDGVHFLQKPFMKNELALMVRKSLDS